MENASKALIIAGAILISILLISVGIMVMNSAYGVFGTMGQRMDSAAIESFNANFTSYQGTSQRGSTVRQLINSVIASNGVPENPPISVSSTATGVTGTGVTDQAALSTMASQVSATARYSVSFTYGTGDQAGLITGVVIGNAGAAPASSTP